jgi:hypothetical protein
MIKCVNCGKDTEREYGTAICINGDGDFVCNQECKEEYEAKRDDFFNNIGDDDYFTSWWDAID